MSISEKLKNICKKVIRQHTYDSSSYIKFLKKQGIDVGKDTVFFDPASNVIDITRPYLLEIGNSVKITHGVTILTHDFSYSVLRIRYGDLLGECSKTKIGNNCFLGMNAIIMPGVVLGNNVIVGSGSVVTRSFPDDVVIAGNPANVICTLEEFYKKRKSNLDHDAKVMAHAIYDKYQRKPTLKEMEVFFPLFLNRDRALLENCMPGGYKDAA